jgi:hypothetical protein
MTFNVRFASGVVSDDPSHDQRFLSTTNSGEQASFATISAARHWLEMDHEICESRAHRTGARAAQLDATLDAEYAADHHEQHTLRGIYE